MQNWNGQIKVRMSLESWNWQGLKLHLEQVWDGLGLLLGASWLSGASLGRPVVIFKIDWSKMVSKRPFKSIWDRTWKFLEGFLDGSGESVSFPAAPHSATGTPALPRYAPWSVTIRGGSQPQTRIRSWLVVVRVPLLFTWPWVKTFKLKR